MYIYIYIYVYVYVLIHYVMLCYAALPPLRTCGPPCRATRSSHGPPPGVASVTNKPQPIKLTIERQWRRYGKPKSRREPWSVRNWVRLNNPGIQMVAGRRICLYRGEIVCPEAFVSVSSFLEPSWAPWGLLWGIPDRAPPRNYTVVGHFRYMPMPESMEHPLYTKPGRWCA